MRSRKHFITLALLCAVFFSACKRQHHNVTRAFYYWKTVYKPTAFEIKTLQQLQVGKMYIRLFDVDKDISTGHLIPIAPIQLPPKTTDTFKVVPVIFITQPSLAALDEKAIAPLAEKIMGLTGALCNNAGIHPSEIQIDCDWTAGTKDVYFSLLNAIKQQPYFKGKKLSCTIRMHQVKYTVSSGVPPVDKGMLMCYSMGDLKKTGDRNSILDVSEAKDYLKRINTYPLSLDIALPVFQWCVLFRDKKFRGILHDVTPEQVMSSKLFAHAEGNLYNCIADTTWQGYTLKAKDILRVESPSEKDLSDVARFTSQQITGADLNVAFFSCDSITLSKYPPHELEAVYDTYR